MKEREMRPVVDAWLRRAGYEVGHELLFSDYCDVVGFRFAPRTGRRIPPLLDVVIVELKLNKIGSVLSQAKSNQYFVPKSYAAMPRSRCQRMTKRTIQKFVEQGVGLLAVERSVDIVVPAERNSACFWIRDTEYAERLRRKLWRIAREPAKSRDD